MALFQKKPAVSDSAPAYTIGSSKTVLIVGLGNPGEQFSGTRHNMGFSVLDKFASDNDFPGWVTKKDLSATVCIKNLGETRVILCKPETFMNESGRAVQSMQRFFRIYNPDTLVVYDELALPYGQIRAREGGTDAGHNGVKSLLTQIGDDFGRLRVGIGNKESQKTDSAKFVLGKFSSSEKEYLPKILAEASAMITEYIFGGSLPHDTRTVI